MGTLNLFPVRVPIGKAGAPGERQMDVLMTPEFARALSSILERVGGPDGVSTTELEKMIKALQLQALQLIDQIASLFELTDALEAEVQDQAITEAAEPGQVGRDFSDLQLHGLGAAVAALTPRLDDIALLLALQSGPASPQKNIVTGAKGGNAALTSLIAALAKSGIITDSTT